MTGTLSTLVAVATLLAGPGPSPGAAAARRELQALDRALDAAVGKVSRTHAAHMLGAGDACRSYRLPGYGAVWVLAPRLLPGPARAFLWTPHPGRPSAGEVEETIRAMEEASRSVQSPELRREFEKRLRALRAAPAPAPQGKARRAPPAGDEDLEQQLRAIEAQAVALYREAEEVRQEAERAF